MTLRVILPAGQIPYGSTVTKPTGTKQYLLRECVRMYDEVGNRKEISAKEGCRFIVASDGDVSAIPDNKDMMWHAETRDLLDWLEERDDR